VGANNGLLRGAKQDMYEGGIRVPMCSVWPGRIEPGSQSNRIALTMDIFPTVCDAAGASFTQKIDGESMLPTLLGRPLPEEDRLLFWVRRESWHYGGRAYYAARYGKWKLLQNNPFEPMQLFDLENDPLEKHPIDSEHEMYKKLFNALRDHILESGAVPWQRQ